MIQTLTQPITFDEFIEWKPDDKYYELRNGVIVEMQPKGKHEKGDENSYFRNLAYIKYADRLSKSVIQTA